MAHKKSKTCLFSGCGKPNFAHGYCSGHAAQIRRGQPLTELRKPRPDAAEGYRYCSHCKQFQPIEQFSPAKQRDGYSRTCKPCRAEAMREYNARNAEAIRLKVTLRNWGLTKLQYKALFEAQDDKCAICGAKRRESKNLSIDHDHHTLLIRGLLCGDCNLGMGQFADNPDLLEKAAKYIREGGVVHDPTLRVPGGGAVDQRSKIRDSERSRTGDAGTGIID